MRPAPAAIDRRAQCQWNSAIAWSIIRRQSAQHGHQSVEAWWEGRPLVASTAQRRPAATSRAAGRPPGPADCTRRTVSRAPPIRSRAPAIRSRAPTDPTRTTSPPPPRMTAGEDPSSGWPSGWPLPAPCWSPSPPPVLFDSAGSLAAFRATLDRLLADHLAQHSYDCLDVFLRFRRAYGRWRRAGAPGTFDQWRRQFVVLPEPEHLTCVGLSSDLLRRLADAGSTFASHFYLASAEEEVDQVAEYVARSRPPERNENDHCLVACLVRVADRRGVLLLDSGYHVPRAVCAMADRLPPHTGAVAMDCLSGQLTHEYRLSDNGKFVTNTICKTSAAGVTSTEHSCIFVGGRFENPYAFAEYRNIFHTLRSLVRRSSEGRLLSGLYFRLRRPEEAAVTVFWHAGDGRRLRVRLPLSALAEHRLSRQQLQALETTGRQLRLPPPQWERLLQEVVEALSDRQFIQSVLRVDDEILRMLDD